MNKSKVVDALNGVQTKDSFDPDHVADYLWTYADGIDISTEIINELDKEDQTSKSKEEFKAYLLKNYKSKLDEYDKAIKRSVDKKLKEGYTKTKARLEQWIKTY